MLIVSEHILSELERAFQDPYYRARISPQQAERTLRFLRTEAILTPLTVPVIGVATQPKDDLVLSTALSGQASILCTRDKQLLKLRSFQTVDILSPGEFLTLLESEGLA
jgi:predicted nucleic acid-binding protein